MEYLTLEQIEELRQFDTPTICNAIEAFGVRPPTVGYTSPGLHLHVAKEDKPMVGYARTGMIACHHAGTSCHETIREEYYRQYEGCTLPQVAVIQDVDTQAIGSFWGDVQATIHRALGCIGTITNGGVRDLVEVEKVGFYLFSKEVLISHAHIHFIASGNPVEVFGLTVHPGDLIHADYHGAIVIPHEIAPKLAAACRQAMDAENAMLLPCRQALAAGRQVTAKELTVWRTEMSKARQEIGK